MEDTSKLMLNDKIIIKSASDTKHQTLKERLADFDGDYIFSEWGTDAPVGQETL